LCIHGSLERGEPDPEVPLFKGGFRGISRDEGNKTDFSNTLLVREGGLWNMSDDFNRAAFDFDEAHSYIMPQYSGLTESSTVIIQAARSNPATTRQTCTCANCRSAPRLVIQR
jgi:hypothetical protein